MINRLKSSRAAALVLLHAAVLAQTPLEAPPSSVLEVITVTATKEKSTLQETPASLGVIREDALRFASPSHPQQLLSQIPGVAVGVTQGEGHTMAIRQPFSTSPVYLYLEDGIPTRATGFFNHNALYEINLPQANSVEVIRGPGSALYGSDAIAGTIHVITRAPDRANGVATSFELGSFGWRRVLADGTFGAHEDGGLRISINRSHSDGWRDATGYDRTSANLRWDKALDTHTFIKTILGYTQIDQQTGANSPLPRADYDNHPTQNHFSVAYRKVNALRLSSEITHDRGDDVWTWTPYLRSNQMDLNGSYNFSSDPRLEKTDVTSWGLLSKWRRDLDGAWKPRLIAGLDLENSPGSRTEDALNMSSQPGTFGANKNYTGYTVGNRIYDYDVTFRSSSWYSHLVLHPSAQSTVTLGLRYDHITFAFNNHLSDQVQVGSGANVKYYAQAADARPSFSHVSPKLGWTFLLAPQVSLYASHNQGFRVPAESQLFRAGSDTTAGNASAKALLALSLKPIQAQQTEVGVRGSHGMLDYDVVAYRLVKVDDLLTQKDLSTNVTTAMNAGKTQHQGMEFGVGININRWWRIDSALSVASHQYIDWVTSTANYCGNTMEAAPKTLANTRLTWRPDANNQLELEWVYLGPYWLEAGNSPTYGKYEGHQVFHLRARHALSDSVSVYARLMNIMNQRYADSASVSSNTPVFSPALPRSMVAGVNIRW